MDGFDKCVCCAADRELTLRTKVLDAFTHRWLATDNAAAMRAPAAELSAVLALLYAEDASQLLPMSPDGPVLRLLKEALHGSDEAVASSGRVSLGNRAKAQRVRLVPSAMSACVCGCYSNLCLLPIRCS